MQGGLPWTGESTGSKRGVISPAMADTSCLAPTHPVHHQGMTREQADIKNGSTEYGGGGGEGVC